MTPTSLIAEAPPRFLSNRIPTIHLMENHDSAYYLWKKSGVIDRTLVHFDGHLDFYWIAEGPAGGPSRKTIDIGNFIYPAIQEGRVTAFYWVIPDPFWETPEERTKVRTWMENLIRLRPHACGDLIQTEEGLELSVLGCPLVVCTLAALPAFSKPVLLDIDVDYLLTWSAYGVIPYFNDQYPGPWIGPTDFLHRLEAKAIPTDFITIAYSVEGGFTPIEYKFFGEALRRGLVPGQTSRKTSVAASYLAFRQALQQRDWIKARTHWQRTLRLDPSYRTAFAIPALREEKNQHWQAAEELYDAMTRIAPTWPFPHLGKGRSLLRLGEWKKAEAAFQRARTLSRGATEATYWLGRCAAQRGQWTAARRFWNRAIRENAGDLLSLYALAHLALQQQDFAAALRFGRRAAAQKQLHEAHVFHRGGTSMDSQPDVLTSVYQRQSRMVTRKVAGEVILVPVVHKIEEDPSLFTLDEVAGFLWNQIDGQRSGQDLVHALQDAYTVNADQAAQDVREFLEQLMGIDAIQAVAAVPA